MEKRKIASFGVTPNLIEQALQFPPGHEIVGAEWDWAGRCVRLIVEGPELPEIERGQLIPSIVPVIHCETDAQGKRLYRWEWMSQPKAVAA